VYIYENVEVVAGARFTRSKINFCHVV